MKSMRSLCTRGKLFEIHIFPRYFIYSSLFYFRVLKKKIYSNSFDEIKRRKEGKKKIREEKRI